MDRRTFVSTAAVSGAFLLAGCFSPSDDNILGVADKSLTLTTTTSTYDTGVVGELNDGFTRRFGAEVHTVAQGTGAAIRTARNGDADVVLVHARSLEDDFIADGYGVNRRDLMFNDFVVVGPEADPAGIAGTADVAAAFAAIADTESTFVSRGDNSGTHQRELAIWTAADIVPSGGWYREAGGGMGEVLNHANLEGEAYTLADRGTYRSMREQLDRLELVVEGPIEGGDELLANPYSIIAVNPGRHGHVAYDLAMAYIGYVTSVEGQDTIASVEVGGEPLFYPRAIAADPNFEQYVPEDWRGGADG